MKRIITILLITIGLTLVPTVPAQAASNCERGVLGLVCARLVAQDVVVSVGGVETIRIPAPVNNVEVIVPQLIPGPTKTILVPVPGTAGAKPRATITIRVPQPTKTVTKTVPSPVPSPVLTGSSPSVTVVPTPVPGQTITVPGPVRERDRFLNFSVPQAIGISFLFLILGIIIGLIGMFITYTLGFKDAEKTENRDWKSFRDEIIGRD